VGHLQLAPQNAALALISAGRNIDSILEIGADRRAGARQLSDICKLERLARLPVSHADEHAGERDRSLLRPL
jgi:hypothetical protein